MPATDTPKRRAKREQILGAAAEVFAHKGFSGTVMADIATAAAVGKGTLYEYFPSKEDLFFGVFHWVMVRQEAATRIGIDRLGGSALDRLRAVNRAVVDACLEMQDLYGLVIEFWAAAGYPRTRERFKATFREGYRMYRRTVAALIEDGQRQGEVRSDVDGPAVAAALVGMWDALGLQVWFDPGFDARAAADAFIDTLIRGVSA